MSKPSFPHVLRAVAATLVLLPTGPALARGADEAPLITNVRQLTFEGKRAGEGYFSRDGRRMIFQSERQPENPFYQIYLMDLETGDTRRMSPGTGKTTCAWVHPDGDKVLFASTHMDPEAEAKQRDELKKRAEGKARRYSWSFDPSYDIFEVGVDGGPLVNLTRTMGYDAEGSWSPDGKQILFASNRSAYEGPLSDKEKEILKRDASYFMELYIMNADGSNVRRLTNTPGYDGGPFFSHDGSRITWRRFAADGGSAEIYTARPDGSGARAVTRLGAMSWAPYFHPSGDYLIFATNLHGFGNFELYMVDAAGDGEPVRVTNSDGFDGLPVFSPDGKKLSWSSSRTADKKPQIFLADWDDAAARRLLGIDAKGRPMRKTRAAPRQMPTSAALKAADLRRHVEKLASEEMEGRLTGSVGEKRATEYVAGVFRDLGLKPAGDDGTFFQAFEFTAGVRLGGSNGLTVEGVDEKPVLDQDWRPLGLSAAGPAGPAEMAFAGYGMVAPAGDGHEAYNSYAGLDVKGKWAMVLRYLPEDVTPAQRQHLYRYAELSYKAAVARNQGALGLIVVSGPKADVRERLVPLTLDAAGAGGSLAAISVSDGLAAAILAKAGKDLKAEQEARDTGKAVAGFAVPGVRISAHIDTVKETRTGRNVLARLNAGRERGENMVVLGAHVDHLGRGVEGKSLARPEEKGQIHPGADDNASGVAGLMEIAEYLANEKDSGRLSMKRDLLFAAWSGEELGLLGSSHFTRTLGGEERDDLRPQVTAYLNMDMIGHLDKSLTLQGVGSSKQWPKEIERRNVPVGLSIVTNESAFLPTDATSFYLKGVPVLNAFTGPHANYSSPRDTADTLNYEGARKVAQLMVLITRSLLTAEETPDYVYQPVGDDSPRRRTSRIYLGSIPDYTKTEGGGTRISGVAKGGPAEAAGIRGGDVIVELAGKAIANIYDYSYALDSLKANTPVKVVVLRDGKRITLTLVPVTRD